VHIYFFSNEKEGQDNATYQNAVKGCVSFYFADDNTVEFKDILEQVKMDRIATVVDKLKHNFPKVTPNLTASPLAWTRLAFSFPGDIRPSNHFFSQYGRWRFSRLATHGIETVVESKLGSVRSKTAHTFTIDSETFDGYTMDEFLLNVKIDAGIFSKKEWKLLAVTGHGRPNHQIAPTTKPNTRNRSTKEVVGKRFLINFSV
jgi:hypothetical protein